MHNLFSQKRGNKDNSRIEVNGGNKHISSSFLCPGLFLAASPHFNHLHCLIRETNMAGMWGAGCQCGSYRLPSASERSCFQLRAPWAFGVWITRLTTARVTALCSGANSDLTWLVWLHEMLALLKVRRQTGKSDLIQISPCFKLGIHRNRHWSQCPSRYLCNPIRSPISNRKVISKRFVLKQSMVIKWGDFADFLNSNKISLLSVKVGSTVEWITGRSSQH